MKELLTTVEHQEYLAVLAMRHGCVRITNLAKSFISFVFKTKEERDLFRSYIVEREYHVDYEGEQTIEFTDVNKPPQVYYIIDITKPDW